jgi:hypothetical protein
MPTDCLRWLDAETVALGNPKPSKEDELNILIDFMMFADFIDHLGPFDLVLQEIRSLLPSRTAFSRSILELLHNFLTEIL